MRKDKYFNIFYLSRSIGFIIYGVDLIAFEYKDNDTMEIVFIEDKLTNFLIESLKPFSSKLADREKVQFNKAWHNYLKKLDEGYTCSEYIKGKYFNSIYAMRAHLYTDFF